MKVSNQFPINISQNPSLQTQFVPIQMKLPQAPIQMNLQQTPIQLNLQQSSIKNTNNHNNFVQSNPNFNRLKNFLYLIIMNFFF